jgi:hypothetical protein
MPGVVLTPLNPAVLLKLWNIPNSLWEISPNSREGGAYLRNDTRP